MAEPYLGQIIMFGGNFAIRSYAFCDGFLLPIAQNSALFSLLGTTYGGDGETTFGLPDLRGRVPIHPGNGAGLTNRRLGEKGGQENVALTSSQQLPPHSHSTSTRSTANEGDSSDPTGNFPARSEEPVRAYHTAATGFMNNSMVVIGQTGQSSTHNNMPPFLGLNFMIALVGVYPSEH